MSVNLMRYGEELPGVEAFGYDEDMRAGTVLSHLETEAERKSAEWAAGMNHIVRKYLEEAGNKENREALVFYLLEESYPAARQILEEEGVIDDG